MNSEDTAMNEPTTNWRDLIKVHPAADAFPMMSPEELDALAEDISKNGLEMCIETWVDPGDGQEWLIDGRNRLDALERLAYRFARKTTRYADSIQPEHLIIYEPNSRKTLQVRQHGGDPYELTSRLNIRRRHLTADQRKEIAAELLKANPARSNRSIAAETKLDDKTVAAIRRDAEAGAEIPHVENRVGKDGKKQPAGKKSSRKGTSAKKSAAKASDAQPASCSPLPRRNVDHLQPIFVELEKLLKGITAKEDQEAIGLFIGNLWADTTDAQPAAVELSEAANEDEPKPSQPEDEPPTTPGVEEPNDRVSRLVSRFNALPANRQKWCLDRLDKPEDAINQVKNNETWRDTSDWLTAFVASTAADQTAFRAQVQAQPIAA